MTIKSGTYQGIQGCIASRDLSEIIIEDGTFSTVNTPGARDAWHAVYSSTKGKFLIKDGKFSTPTENTGEQGYCVTTGNEDDKNYPNGFLILQGGEFSTQAFDRVNKKVINPAEGYIYQDITDGNTYKYQIVKKDSGN